MVNEVIVVLQDLGFETQDYERIVQGIMVLKNDIGFTVSVDIKSKTVDLTHSHLFVSGFLLKRQVYLSASDLKDMLLRNKVFTHYQSSTLLANP